MQNWKDQVTLVADLFELYACFISTKKEVITLSKRKITYNPLILRNKKTPKEHTDLFNSFVPLPRVRNSPLFERYILLSMMEEEQFIGTVILGPSITNNLSPNKLTVLLKEHQAFSSREEVKNYYNRLPIYSTNKLIKISMLLYQLLNNKVIAENVIKDDYLDSLQLRKNEEKETEKTIMDFIPTKAPHERLFENEILKIVKNGDIESLQKNYFVKDMEDVPLYSNSSYIRSLKNHLISMISLISRVAIIGGFNSDASLAASDDYILKIEEAFSQDELYRLAAEMIVFFTTKVREAKTVQYSAVVTQAIHYIANNLYMNFQINDIAKFVAVSPNYLSALFTKETGETLTAYIQKSRISEAKYILKTSQLSIHDISNLLSFSDQSYFTKVFKKYVGLSPNQYRNNG